MQHLQLITHDNRLAVDMLSFSANEAEYLSTKVLKYVIKY